jgi:hypothetical protein
LFLPMMLYIASCYEITEVHNFAELAVVLLYQIRSR